MPKTVLGRISVIFFIVIGIAVLSDRLSKLLNFIQLSKFGLGRFRPGFSEKIFIVTGDLEFSSFRAFLEQIYHPDYACEIEEGPTRVVVLSKKIFEDDNPFRTMYKEFLEVYPVFSNRVTILNGTPFSSKDLLYRAKAKYCEAAVVFSDLNDPENDVANLLRALSFHKVNTECKVHLILEDATPLLPPSHPVMKNAIAHLTLKMDCLAVACSAPCFIPFLFNLTNTFQFEDPFSEKQECMFDARREYFEGMDKEFYVVLAKEDFYNKTLGEIVLSAYSRYRVLVVGMGFPTSHGFRSRFSFSFSCSDYVRESSVLLVIASDRNSANLVGEDVYKDQLGSFASRSRRRSSSSRLRGDMFDNIPAQNKHFFKLKRDKKSVSESGGTNLNPTENLRRLTDVSLPAPPPKLSDHVIIMCSHMKVLGRFITKLRQIESSKSTEQPPVSIVILCTSGYSSVDIAGLPLKYLNDVYFSTEITLSHFADMSDLCVESARTIILLNQEVVQTNLDRSAEDMHLLTCWIKLRRYIDQIIAFNEGKVMHRPHIILESSSGEILKYLDMFNIDEDGSWKNTGDQLWRFSSFAQGHIYPRLFANLVTTHALSNFGFFAFFRELVGNCGTHHNFELFQVKVSSILKLVSLRTERLSALWKTLFSFHLS